MKFFSLVGLVFFTSIMTAPGFASETTENIYLTQILNQLDAMQPLIIAAQKSQPKNTRIEFHYVRYRDSHGHVHNGLLDDIQAIKRGIQEQLNQPTIEPRVVAPILGDYIQTTHKSH